MTASKTTPDFPMWRYREGTWEQIPDYLGDWDDYGQALDDAGFGRADTWGTLAVPRVEIYEHYTDREHWRVDVSIGHGAFYTVEITRLPDLIGLLGKLAPIAAASLLSQQDEERRQARP